ncbi:MAG: Abortive infection protein [Firmicutes bacterium]|nr:Abortive infection protein [Bacillota bacterium]
MLDYEIAKEILVFLLLIIPPLLVYIRFWRERDRSMMLISAISIIYIIAAIFTQNLMPFILVLFNIAIMKGRVEFEEYGFSLKGFSFIKGMKYSVFSYFITIVVAIVSISVMAYFGIGQEEQEVVKWMTDLPLEKFWIAVPVAAVFAPVVEEFVFRWFFFERLFKKSIGLIAGAVLSSLIFAFIHFNIQAFPMILWIGMYNCYLIEKKGYWYSVFNHLFFNSVTVAALLMDKI